MKLKEYLLPEIEREIDRSKRALEQVPTGKYDWKPHEKSMDFGYLVNGDHSHLDRTPGQSG